MQRSTSNILQSDSSDTGIGRHRHRSWMMICAGAQVGERRDLPISVSKRRIALPAGQAEWDQRLKASVNRPVSAGQPKRSPEHGEISSQIAFTVLIGLVAP